MTAETQDSGLTEAKKQAQRPVDELQEGVDRLGEHIAESRATLKAAQEDRSIPTSSGDTDDIEDDEAGEAAGFDDPESDEEEDDEPEEAAQT